MSEQTDIEKSTSEQFKALWIQLNHNQQRFAIAMIGSATKKEAAESVGIKPNTTYGWNGIVDEVVSIMRTYSADTALAILENEVPKAAMIKALGLDSDNERIRQDSASEILDRNLGKPTQRQELTGADGGPLKAEVTTEEISEEELARRVRAIVDETTEG